MNFAGYQLINHIYLKTSFKRILIYSLLSAILDMIVFLACINNIILYQILYALIHIIMIKTCYKIIKFTDLLTVFLLLQITFSSFYALIDKANKNTFISYSLFLLVIYCVFIFITNKLINKQEEAVDLVNVSLSIKSSIITKELNLVGYYDSGNTLVDPFTENPVIILSADTISNYFDNNFKTILKEYAKSGYFDYKAAANITDLKFYPVFYKTISDTKSIMPAFKLESISYKDKNQSFEKVTAGISKGLLTTDNSYTVLLNKKLKPIREENSND